ncbi:MAG TPA: MBL fold metallo-hydrolase [Pseudobacteroides sp.]|uniref:MBL fold metallo-hydrolase n=1 Tax=Pseudobacteroides sp. TaxID=1968840 RepID=UPI002F941AAF
MLNFLGKGSAFNTKLGNNSCYIQKDNSMLLIDAGGTVFHKLQELDLFNGLKNLHIVITHTHPDHCGSLGEIIFYPFYYNQIKPMVYFPDRKLMEGYFKVIGVRNEMCSLVSDMEATIKDSSLGEIKLKFIKVPHVETIPAFGFIMEADNKRIYYSGDANSIPDEVLSLLKNGSLDILYQDTCGIDYDKNAHLSINKLKDIIPDELRRKVWCMHQDGYLDSETAVKLGFNLV